MRNDKRNYVAVGAFVISMVAALILWIALLSGQIGTTHPYHMYFDNVARLKEGVDILYEGFPVGLIESIRYEEDPDEGRKRYRVDVSVREEWEIPEDSVATIQSGIFSASVIEIGAGSSPTSLAPGSRVDSREPADALAAIGKVAGRAEELLDEQVVPILDDLAESVPTVVSNVRDVSERMKTVMDQMNQLLGPTNVDRVGRILVNMEDATADVDELVVDLSSTRRNIDEVILSLDRLLEEDRGDLSVAVSELRYTLTTLSRHVDGIAANLEEATRNLNEFSKHVRQNPGVLLRGREPGGG